MDTYAGDSAYEGIVQYMFCDKQQNSFNYSFNMSTMLSFFSRGHSRDTEVKRGSIPVYSRDLVRSSVGHVGEDF